MNNKMSEQEILDFYDNHASSMKDLENSKIGMSYTIASIKKLLSNSLPTKSDWTYKGAYIAAIPKEQRPEWCGFEVFYNGNVIVKFYTNRELKCMYDCNKKLIDDKIDLLSPDIDEGRGHRKLHQIELVRQSLYEIAFEIKKWISVSNLVQRF